MTTRRHPRDRPPLDAAALDRLALGYAGRYATSAARLRAYLARKVAERGWDGEIAPDYIALAARFVELGYIDDAALAEARGRSLARRGLGRQRVAAALAGLGIGAADAAATIADARADAWATALRFAERRRLGPFAAAVLDLAGRRRAIAAMLRAGHEIDHVRKIMAAAPGEIPPCDEY